MTSPWRPAITIPYPTLLSHSPDKPANDTHPPSPRPLKIPNACHFRSSATSPHGGHSSRGCHHAAAGIGAPAGHEPSRRLSRGVQLCSKAHTSRQYKVGISIRQDG
ncbi:hypothetical protein B0T18DRAFT_26419 [Schizothecium vesticola]|uniref:Uncharacterized protein n=1 Tax=Schizothecium vesticola TaxID=314040 RepID=A0AA40FA40_9PEZI|nr:hypothetical protein B0T18DRAFT_26419 [Schizothecium vesticola]